MKILIVGFQPYEKITYPHLKQVVDYLSERGSDYCLFRERGYFLDEAFRPGISLTAWRRFIYTFGSITIDSIRLIRKRFLNRYDLVISIDSFAFIAASTLFKNVVLWSHDFVTDDQERSHAWIHKLIKQKLSESLNEKASLIIQDEARLSLFCARYLPNRDDDIDPFFLPVSLLPGKTYAEFELQKPPVLLQIGGINSWRSMSDKLLCHYQTHFRDYALAFHGFIDQEMQQSIKAVDYLPWVSSIELDPNCVCNIVEKCDIGFIAYNASDLNFYYIARASGQLVEYLRCGKPLIVLGNTDLRRLVDEQEIGVAIHDIDELSVAITKIVSNYSSYSSNCKSLYDEVYNLNSYLSRLNDWLTKRAAL